MKPLGIKSYGSIPHFSNSKLGSGDYHCHIGQENICTVKARDKNDIIIIQEKLDGGNVGVCKVDGKIHAITRAGYLALTSPYATHWAFDAWVHQNEKRFSQILKEGERVCGEWLLHAVGTRYNLPHEPFVAFDLMLGSKRQSIFEAEPRMALHGFIFPKCINMGAPMTTDKAMQLLGNGGHGAIDKVEGLIYRVERNGVVDFLCKYVRPDKENGIYLPEISGKPYVENNYYKK